MLPAVFDAEWETETQCSLPGPAAPCSGNAQSVDTLHALGVKVAMISGDAEQVAAAVA